MQYTLNLTGLSYVEKYQRIEQGIRSFNREQMIPVRATFYFEEETKIEFCWHLKAIQPFWAKKITLKMISHASWGTFFSKTNTKRSYRNLADFPIHSISRVVLTPFETKAERDLKTLEGLWSRKYPTVWNHLSVEEIADYFPTIETIDFAKYFPMEDLSLCSDCMMAEEEFYFKSQTRTRTFELVGEYGIDGYYRTWLICTDHQTNESNRYILLNLKEAILDCIK